MNSNVHPLVVALVLVLTGIALATWMWGSGAAANIGGPAEMKVDANGHIYVQIQSKLVEHDAYGQYLKTHNVRDMGVELFLGSFAFFSNGDVLLRRGPDPRSFGDNVRAFQRKTNEDSIVPDSVDAGLFRCNLDTQYCERFGISGVDFKAAYGMFIDWRTDDVYISDTTRHVLRKYSSDGVEVAGPITGFKFPNQLLLHDGQLLVADTNNHEIRHVDPKTGSFGSELGRKNVAPAAAVGARRTWPSHFARVGSEWWINIMRTGMNQGAIYIFDDNWRLNRELNMPDDADPIALVTLANEVWVSDWYGDSVRRFSKAGESLGDLESAGLETILGQARVERRKFEIISYSGIGLLLLTLGGLAVRGFAVGMTANAVANDPSAGAPSSEATIDLQPDPRMLARMRWAARLFISTFILLAALILFIIVFHTKPEVGYQLILPSIGLLLIVLLISWINRSNRGTAIRIDGDLVTLRDHTGRESSCSLHEVRYDETAIATRDAVVFLGRPMASIYKRKILKSQLFPRLATAMKVSPLQMQQILLQQRHPQGVSAILAFVGLLVYAVWLIAK